MKNGNLHAAKTAKNDEFYTRLVDIEEECWHYKDHFKDAVVYCNCDDARQSNFFKYFSLNFEFLGLKKLITTSYNPNGHGTKFVYEGDKNGNRMPDDSEIEVTELEGNGDFRSPECVELIKEADVVVTNPPFSCYSSDTEVLTLNGWKLFKNIDIETDLIYSLNPQTNEIEVVKAIDSIKSPINGSIYNFQNRFMDLMVTGNHKMLAHSKSNDGYKCKGLIDASDIKKTDLLPIKGFNYEGANKEFFVLPSVIQKEQYTRKEIQVEARKINMNDWLEFFGFWLADGCTRQGLNSQGNPRNVVSIKQSLANKEYVVDLYKRIGFECKLSISGRDKGNFEVYNKQLWEYLNQFGKSEQKYIPREFLNLGKENLYYLYKGYINGDSHKGNGGIILSSKSKSLMNDFQEIILKLFGQIVAVRAVNTTYNNEPYRYYKISFRDTYHHNYSKYGNPKKVDYNDYVYCLTLEKNHIMLVRRDGKMSWCGNCFRDYVRTLVENDKKFLVIGNMNAITYKEIFPLIKENKLWLGCNPVKSFIVPLKEVENEKTQYIDKNGQVCQKFGNILWFTNLDHKKRHYDICLNKRYDPELYPKYDNYDAIEVSKVIDIPYNYDGVMGVPITFLGKYNPKQFEIVEFRKGSDGKDLVYSSRGGRQIQPYFRILIRRCR